MMHEKLVAGIKVNGKVMREFNNNIFIPFGSDYSILLMNLNSQKVQINIEVDGKDILNGESLLVNPNDKLDLERWLVGGNKKGPKLKFVEKTEEIRETKHETGLDGIVKISYQFEKFKDWNYFPSFRGTFHYENPNVFRSYTTYDSPIDQPRCMSNVSEQNISSSANTDGFTVKGEESNQLFQQGYIGTLESEIHTICFNLKGGSGKLTVLEPITVKTKITCDACFKKNKSSYKFCTQCGNNLKY